MKKRIALLLALSLLIGLTAPACAENETADDLPSLKEIYADRFDFGAALSSYAMQNKQITALVCRQFSIITAENEMKPSSLLDVTKSKQLAKEDETAAAVRFDTAKPLLDFAKNNGLKVHGHVLVWHSQTPEAFFHEGYDAAKPYVTREVMLGRLENYIRGVMAYLDENYPGLVVSWDVVNEAIDDGTHDLRKSAWYDTIGEDYVSRAFELARKYAPEGTLLYYNDYSTYDTLKLTGILKLLNTLVEEGTIDGYGFQMHVKAKSPGMEQVLNCVKKIFDLGLRLRVSEMDVGVDDASEASFASQADKYARLMKLFIKYADAVEAVQVWGVVDTMSWRSGEHPLLFDGAYSPKPAFYAVADPYSF